MNTSSLRTMRTATAPLCSARRSPMMIAPAHHRIVFARAAAGGPGTPGSSGTPIPPPVYSPALAPTGGIGSTGTAYSPALSTTGGGTGAGLGSTPGGGSGAGSGSGKGLGGGGSSGGSSGVPPSENRVWMERLAFALKLATGLAVLYFVGTWVTNSGKGQELIQKGKKTASDTASSVKHTTEKAVDDVKKKTPDAKHVVEEAKKKVPDAKQVQEGSKNLYDNAVDTVGSVAHQLADRVTGTSDAVTGAAKSGVDSVRHALTPEKDRAESKIPFYALVGAGVVALTGAVGTAGAVYAAKKRGGPKGPKGPKKNGTPVTSATPSSATPTSANAKLEKAVDKAATNAGAAAAARKDKDTTPATPPTKPVATGVTV